MESNCLHLARDSWYATVNKECHSVRNGERVLFSCHFKANGMWAKSLADATSNLQQNTLHTGGCTEKRTVALSFLVGANYDNPVGLTNLITIELIDIPSNDLLQAAASRAAANCFRGIRNVKWLVVGKQWAAKHTSFEEAILFNWGNVMAEMKYQFMGYQMNYIKCSVRYEFERNSLKTGH